MTSQEIIDNALKSESFYSRKYEYERDNYGYLKMPMNLKRSYYEYKDIGDNLELDSYGYLGGDSNYIYASPHKRNVTEVDKYFLANIIARIAQFTRLKVMDYIEKMNEGDQGEKVSWQKFIDGIDDAMTFKINSIILDPGFTNHREGEERTTGIRVGSMIIKYPEIFTPNAEFILNNGLRVKILLYNPNAYRETLRVMDVGPINLHLRQAHGMRNSLQKIQHKNELLFRKPTKIKTLSFDIIDTKNKRHLYFPDGLTITYEFIGKVPNLDYSISPMYADESLRLIATWKHQETEKKGNLVLHMPKELTEILGSDLLNTFENVGDFKKAFFKKLNNILFKHNLEVHEWDFKYIKYVYDTDEDVYIESEDILGNTAPEP